MTKHKAVVACSGGVDSVALCHYLKRLDKLESIFHLVYEDSIEFSEAALDCVQRLSKTLNVPLTVKRESEILETESSNNKEKYWRDLRYRAISSLYKNKTVCLAHHMDDQLTSYILSLLKDSARCFIPPINQYESTEILRPFTILGVDKAQIYQYVEKYQLEYVEDPMNSFGDRSTIDSILINLKLISQLMPIFKKKYKKYMSKVLMDYQYINNLFHVIYSESVLHPFDYYL